MNNGLGLRGNAMSQSQSQRERESQRVCENDVVRGRRAGGSSSSREEKKEDEIIMGVRRERNSEGERPVSTSAAHKRSAAALSVIQPPPPPSHHLPRSAVSLSHGHDRSTTKYAVDGLSIGDEELDLDLDLDLQLDLDLDLALNRGGHQFSLPRKSSLVAAHTTTTTTNTTTASTTKSHQQLFHDLCSLEAEASDDSMESYFPSYQDVAARYSNKNQEEDEDREDTTGGRGGDSCSTSSSCDTSESPGAHALDDTYLVDTPTMHVDYLSHKWLEEDMQASWRHMVANRSQRQSMENGYRLENAFWRAWGQKRWNLKTVHPQSIQWIGKDCDTTWLYGPFIRGKSEPRLPAAVPSAKRKDSGIEVDSDSPRPILKTPRLCELFLQQSFSDVSLSGPVSPILEMPTSAPSLLKPTRMKLEKFKTYSMASNSGRASPMRAKAVKFSGQVAQCISVDTEPVPAPNFGSHHPVLRRSTRSIHGSSRSSSADNSRASSPKPQPQHRCEKVQLIEPLPSTQLKPEGKACPLQSKLLGLNRKLFSLRDAALLSSPASLAAKERSLKSQLFAAHDDDENMSPSPESEPESPPRYDDLIDYKLLSQRITTSVTAAVAAASPRPTNLPRSIVDRFYDLNSSEFDGSDVPTPPSMSDQFSSGSDDEEFDFLTFPAYPDMATSDNLLDTQAPNQFDCEEPKIAMSSGSVADSYGGGRLGDVVHVNMQGGRAGKREGLLGMNVNINGSVNINGRRPSSGFAVKSGKGFGHARNNDEEMWWSMV